jgi:hypothetical protein
MADIFHLYISAAQDLNRERESLSQAVAEIPVTLGWRITQSPLHSEPLNEAAIAQADMHILLLGKDLRAPIGLEWYLARRANHLPATFMEQDAIRTMAALDFSRYLAEQTTWRMYKGIGDLRWQVQILLVDFILARSSYYTLRIKELEKLTDWRKELDAPEKKPAVLYGGIGESSVVLSPERYIPSEGVLLQAPPKNRQNQDPSRKTKH